MCMHGSVQKSWPKAIIPTGWQPAIYGTQTGQTVDLVGFLDSILFLQQSWNLDAFTPKFSTMHAVLVPLGLAQIDPGLAGICFAMQNPRPRMACHCMSQVFSWLLCAWQWHLLESWRLHCGPAGSSGCPGNPQWPDLDASHIGSPWLAAGSRLGDSKL